MSLKFIKKRKANEIAPEFNAVTTSEKPTSTRKRQRTRRAPIITKPKLDLSLSFGLKISDFILRDIAILGAAPAKPDQCSPRQKVLAHSSIVKHQLKAFKLAENEREKALWTLRKEKARQTFPFALLPSELRSMVFEYYFSSACARRAKPSLLWALGPDDLLYREARVIYYKVQEFRCTIRESRTNKTVERMSEQTRKMVRVFRIILPSTLLPATTPSTTLFLLPNLTHLTISLSFALSVPPALLKSLLQHLPKLLPRFTSLIQISLILYVVSKKLKRRTWDDFYLGKDFSEVCEKMNEILGVKGVYRKDGRGKGPHMQLRKEWVWRVEKRGEVFKPVVKIKHVKFE